jgi:hypothetical protein
LPISLQAGELSYGIPDLLLLIVEIGHPLPLQDSVKALLRSPEFKETIDRKQEKDQSAQKKEVEGSALEAS